MIRPAAQERRLQMTGGPVTLRAFTGASLMLVSCVAYQDGKKLADIKPDEIHEYVHRPECFVWVGLCHEGVIFCL